MRMWWFFFPLNIILNCWVLFGWLFSSLKMMKLVELPLITGNPDQLALVCLQLVKIVSLICLMSFFPLEPLCFQSPRVTGWPMIWLLRVFLWRGVTKQYSGFPFPWVLSACTVQQNELLLLVWILTLIFQAALVKFPSSMRAGWTESYMDEMPCISCIQNMRADKFK